MSLMSLAARDKDESLPRRSFPVQQLVFTFAKALKKCLAVNRNHFAGLQIVVPAIEHCASLAKLGNISGHGVLDQPVWGISRFDDQLVNLGLQLGSEMNFHCSQNTGKARIRQHRAESSYSQQVTLNWRAGDPSGLHGTPRERALLLPQGSLQGPALRRSAHPGPAEPLSVLRARAWTE